MDCLMRTRIPKWHEEGLPEQYYREEDEEVKEEEQEQDDEAS